MALALTVALTVALAVAEAFVPPMARLQRAPVGTFDAHIYMYVYICAACMCFVFGCPLLLNVVCLSPPSGDPSVRLFWALSGALPSDHHAFALLFFFSSLVFFFLMGVILFCRKYFCNGR